MSNDGTFEDGPTPSVLRSVPDPSPFPLSEEMVRSLHEQRQQVRRDDATRDRTNAVGNLLAEFIVFTPHTTPVGIAQERIRAIVDRIEEIYSESPIIPS